MKGLVYKSTGSWYLIKKEDGEMVQARIRGKLKTEGITSTNPIAVGDYVMLTETENGDIMIENVLERENYIIRESPQNRNQRHIIAANLDQCILLASLKSPRTSTGFIDRFLVVSEAFHIPTLIVFNKSDLYKEKELNLYKDIAELYSSIGYETYLISLTNVEGLELFDEILANKQTLISGHSGVGKSSFINHFLDKDFIRTEAVSGWSGKGVHTTTFAEMYDLENGGRLIDTPGIRELALAEIESVEISHYFKEMLPLIGKCKFNNCIHDNEPGCAVKDAVRKGEISEERYFSYLKILLGD